VAADVSKDVPPEPRSGVVGFSQLGRASRPHRQGIGGKSGSQRLIT
jgi:hypothetical protein